MISPTDAAAVSDILSAIPAVVWTNPVLSGGIVLLLAVFHYNKRRRK